MTKALAVALVAMSKTLASLDPQYGDRLAQSLESGIEAGVSKDDLKILDVLVTSARATALELLKNRSS